MANWWQTGQVRCTFTRARAKFYREVCAAHLARIVKVDLKSELFTYSIDERALKLARMMDGKLLLVTNAPEFTPEELIRRYKSLADIERGFRVLCAFH